MKSPISKFLANRLAATLRSHTASDVKNILRKSHAIAIVKMVILLLMIIVPPAVAQDGDPFKKGTSVYLESSTKNQNVQETEQAFLESVREAGFWNVVSDKQQANYIVKLDVETSRGITAFSWGGTSVGCSAKIYNKSDAVVWESDTYKVSPNGTNGFNAKKASARKLARAIERKVK